MDGWDGGRDVIREVWLESDRKGWAVSLRLESGELRRYRYGSEAQARYFAQVFALGPRVLPAVPAEKRKRAAPRRLAKGAQQLELRAG